MLIFFNWNIRIRNTFIFFAIIWLYFLDSSWIQFSSWVIFFGLCVVTADLDEDKIGDTFEEFYDEVMGNYSDITNKDYSITEDNWIITEQTKHHLTNFPREIDELLEYRELHAKRDIITEHRKNHSYEEWFKHTKHRKWYSERDDVHQYTSEGLEIKTWVLEIIADWWHANEHNVIPDPAAADYQFMEILPHKQNEKVWCGEARNQLIKEQVESRSIFNQKKLKPYKRLLWSWTERTVRSEPVFWPRSNKRQPKSQRSWKLAVKRARKHKHKLQKGYNRIEAMSTELPSNEQLLEYITQRFGNALCFQPDLAVGSVGKKLRLIVYKNSGWVPKKLNWRLIRQQIKKQLAKQERDWNYDPDIIRAGLLSGDESLPKPRPKDWNAKLKARAKLKVSPKPKGF